MMGEASAAYHPGQSGTLRLGPKKILAEYGVLHPKLVKQFDLFGRVVSAEIFLDAIPVKRKTGLMRPPSAPPALPHRQSHGFGTWVAVGVETGGVRFL